MPTPAYGHWWIALIGTAIVAVLTLGLLSTLLIANRRLREERDFGDSILQEAPAAIAVLDLRGRILRVNDQLCELVGREPDSMEGRSFQEVPVLRDVLAGHSAGAAEALASSAEFEHQVLDAQGRIREFGWSVRTLPSTKGPPRWTVILGVDLTEIKRLQRYVYEAQKLEAVGRLAGGIAHDFNNMLTAILAQCYALNKLLPPEHETARRAVRAIDSTTEKAARLTKQLLAFSRQQVLEARPVRLDQLIEEMGGLIRRLVGESVEVELELDGGTGYIEADPTQIERVLMNLILNARDAMPRGGKLRIATCHLSEEQTRHRYPIDTPRHMVLLTVEDTGTGMDQATLARIFEPFFTTKPPGEGTGLGLSTVYGIVQQLGGYIFVESQVGRGTRFDILFPQANAVANEGVEKRDEDGSPRLRGRVLLVEDDPDVRAMAAEALRETGLAVEVAADGQEALRKSRLSNERIDLLITDVVMPRMSGRELVERMLLYHPHLKILYISGHAEETIRRHGLIEKSAELLAKPFTPGQLQRTVARVMGKVAPA
ncbi:MAG: response regulator [candidate division KSB1 bacterium]|nr:response regulator [candidate division KSB1 bacterium]